jgi:hypothetical protein
VLVPVQVRLAVNSATGKIDRAAPMMVWSEGPDHRPGEYEPDAEVLEQLTEFEAGGRFLAEWDGKRWRIGKRVVDDAKTSPLSL